MSLPRNPLLVIPARLGSTRLPDKPLADIHGEPMIVHVWRRAMEAAIGPVLVACAEEAIVDAVSRAGGRAMLTRADHPSGSDRIHEAVARLDPEGDFDAIINVQGDLPTIDPEAIRAALAALADPEVDIATLAAVIIDPADGENPNIVKAVTAIDPATGIGRALYFSRAAVPTGEGPLYHHIGLYAYRRAALDRFVKLPPGRLERRERLEQLRALENGMRIAVALVEDVPLGVDTAEDLERARLLLAPEAVLQ
jgi:3-deoxy-manno-octulosonate cytidylyltransferase (CMP-KDO synthetase)